jgi:formylglycine-generating enzyme required for sulfatase activity
MLCNRSESEVLGKLLTVPFDPGLRYFYLIRGLPVEPRQIDTKTAELHVPMRPRGIGAIIAGPEEAFTDYFYSFLKQKRPTDSRALFDPTPPEHKESLVPVFRTTPSPPEVIPEGMVYIPARRFDLKIQFRVRECGFYAIDGVPELDLHFRFQHKQKTVTRPVDLAAFALDKTPVTNAAFARFLHKSGYRPAHPDNFLKHWPD